MTKKEQQYIEELKTKLDEIATDLIAMREKLEGKEQIE
jgi:hypothetical protein